MLDADSFQALPMRGWVARGEASSSTCRERRAIRQGSSPRTKPSSQSSACTVMSCRASCPGEKVRARQRWMIRGSVWLPARGDQSLFEPWRNQPRPKADVLGGTTSCPARCSHASQWISEAARRGRRRQAIENVSASDAAPSGTSAFYGKRADGMPSSAGTLPRRAFASEAIGEPL